MSVLTDTTSLLQPKSKPQPNFRRGTDHFTKADGDTRPGFIEARIQGNRNKALRNQRLVLFHMGPSYTKGLAHMADLTGLTVKQVRLAFTRLEESGLIEMIDHSFGLPKVYRRLDLGCSE